MSGGCLLTPGPSVMLKAESVDEGPVCEFVYPPCLCREPYELSIFYVAIGFSSGLLALPADFGWDHQWIVPLHGAHR